MFMLASISSQYILVFISPMVSILLLIIGLAMNAYTSNLSLLASQIEDNLNELLGEEVMKWESTVGIFGGGSKDFMVKRLGKAFTPRNSRFYTFLQHHSCKILMNHYGRIHLHLLQEPYSRAA